ncbi:MAG: hypothetical protein QGH20_01420 [Candidatus Latescibacteria bacterium]|nr:hypothetical protein [Candidatus Latescibacterota bacterium]
MEKSIKTHGWRFTRFMDVRNIFNSRYINRGFFTDSEFNDHVYPLHTNLKNPTLQGKPLGEWATDSDGKTLLTGPDQIGDMPHYAAMPVFDRWALWLDPRYVRWGMRISF